MVQKYYIDLECPNCKTKNRYFVEKDAVQSGNFKSPEIFIEKAGHCPKCAQDWFHMQDLTVEEYFCPYCRNHKILRYIQ